MTPGGENPLAGLLREFSHSLEEANRELLDEVRGELRALQGRIEALEGEVRVTRAEAADLRAELSARAAEVPAAPDPGQEKAQRAAEEIRSRHREVFELLAAGEEPQEVARRTNRPLGEIELIRRLVRVPSALQSPGR